MTLACNVLVNTRNLNVLCAAFETLTTHKPKVDRSIAVTNRISTFYNQQNEKLYEVETSFFLPFSFP